MSERYRPGAYIGCACWGGAAVYGYMSGTLWLALLSLLAIFGSEIQAARRAKRG